MQPNFQTKGVGASVQKKETSSYQEKMSKDMKQSVPYGQEQQFIQQTGSQEYTRHHQKHAGEPMTDVSFNVICQQTQIGDRVALVGNISSLGEWDPEQCLYLETSPITFPTWSISVPLPRGVVIEYKYIVVQHAKMNMSNYLKQNNMGQYQQQSQIPQFKMPPIVSVIWENFGNGSNRMLNTQGKKEIILHEEMSSKKVTEEFIEEQDIDQQQQQISSRPSKTNQDNGNFFNLVNPISNLIPAKNFGSMHQMQLPQFMSPKLQSNVLTPNQSQVIPSRIQLQSNDILHKLKIVPKEKNQPIQTNFESNQNLDIPASPEFKHDKEETKQQILIPIRKDSGSKGSSLDRQDTFGGNLNRQKKDEIMETPTRRDSLLKQPNSKAIPDIKNQQQYSFQKVIEKQANIIKEPKLLTPRNIIEEELIIQPKIEIDKNEPIIIASFLLPYNIERDKKTGELFIKKCVHNPTMLYGTLENMMQKKQFNFHWVGLVTTLEDVNNKEKEELERKFNSMNSYPIFMTAEELGPCLLYYENILRPLFHNFKDIKEIRNDYLRYWKDFLAFNQKMAQKIIEVKNSLKNAQTIWLQNNHLLMVPLYVKKSFEQANIGLFFHSPFPGSAHFRSHKYRFEILKSLLHCDLVAFHLFMYARNFFKTCNRICGFEIEFRRGGFLGINFHGKHVMIRVSHIGIEESFIEELVKSKQFKIYERKLKDEMKIIGSYLNQSQKQIEEHTDSGKSTKKIEKPIIMCSIDSYHPMSGLKNKLLSYQLFLQKYPSYQNRIVFIQFVGSIVQAFDKQEDHQRNVNIIKNLRKKAFQIRDEIHKEFGTQCLLLQESNPPLEKRLALWSSADIILCSSLKDGLCIPVLEYVKCRLMAGKLSNSTMICSEFAGCNEAMRGVFTYNPFSTTALIETMDKALSLPPEEKEMNMKLAYLYVKRNSVTNWTEGFLKDLKLAYQPVQVSYYLGLNFNANREGKNINRLMQEKTDLKKLNMDQCASSLLKANKCAIFIEIESLPHLQFSKHSIPTNEVIEQLHGLLIDNRNTVVIIGNHTKNALESWFSRNAGNNGNNFWLVAESGYLYKPGNKEGWQKLTELNDLGWIKQVKKIMQTYTDNIDGSFIEVRQSCILWNYKNAEQEHGNMFIHDLYNQIEKVIKGTNTEIVYGNGYLEVKPLGIKKQKLVDLLLEKISLNSGIDFLLYMGINSSDEPVYELLNSEKVKNKYLHQDCSTFICTLEKKPSEADYYIEEIDQVRILLEKLYLETKKRKKIRSFADLTVLRTSDNPLATLKLTQNKIASIANLEQYFKSQIGLNDKIGIRNNNDPYSFIPNKGINQKNGYGHLSASPQVIDEESQSSSHHNQPLKLKQQNKFPSVELGGYHKYQLGIEEKSPKNKKKKAENNALIIESKTQIKISDTTPSLQPEQISIHMSLASMVQNQLPQSQASDRKMTNDELTDQLNTKIGQNPFQIPKRADSDANQVQNTAKAAIVYSVDNQAENSSINISNPITNSIKKLTNSDPKDNIVNKDSINPYGSQGQSEIQAINTQMNPQYRLGSYQSITQEVESSPFGSQGVQAQEQRNGNHSPKKHNYMKKIKSMQIRHDNISQYTQLNQIAHQQTLAHAAMLQQQIQTSLSPTKKTGSLFDINSYQNTSNPQSNVVNPSKLKLDLAQLVQNQASNPPAQFLATQSTKSENKELPIMVNLIPHPKSQNSVTNLNPDVLKQVAAVNSEIQKVELIRKEKPN